jgi:hypothetical protein
MFLDVIIIISFCHSNFRTYCYKLTKYRAGPWLRLLVAGLSPRRPGFALRTVPVGFFMDKVALGQVSLRVFRFSSVSNILPWLCTLIYNLSPLQTAVQRQEDNTVSALCSIYWASLFLQYSNNHQITFLRLVKVEFCYLKYSLVSKITAVVSVTTRRSPWEQTGLWRYSHAYFCIQLIHNSTVMQQTEIILA